MKNIIKEVAKAHKMSEQEVRDEMRVAIRTAMKSTDPTAPVSYTHLDVYKRQSQSRPMLIRITDLSVMTFLTSASSLCLSVCLLSSTLS